MLQLISWVWNLPSVQRRKNTWYTICWIVGGVQGASRVQRRNARSDSTSQVAILHSARSRQPHVLSIWLQWVATFNLCLCFYIYIFLFECCRVSCIALRQTVVSRSRKQSQCSRCLCASTITSAQLINRTKSLTRVNINEYIFIRWPEQFIEINIDTWCLQYLQQHINSCSYYQSVKDYIKWLSKA